MLNIALNIFKTIGLHIYMYRDKVTQLHDIYDNRKANKNFSEIFN